MVKFDESISDWRLAQPELSWQVIFKTAEMEDYARETKPGTMTKAAIYRWATRVTKTHEYAKHAIIERF